MSERTITVPEKALRAELEKLIQERDRLTTRLQEAERERDEARKERSDAVEFGARAMENRIAAEAREAALREALEFYADEATYTQSTSWGGRIIDDEGPWSKDTGACARAALAAEVQM